ncbi:MAG: hypothetical protein KAS32_31105 [Candidatus Peribacteraceae bacterium]|nr:hypothetical protein [Candidatus Peribacteraceae bacterium]
MYITKQYINESLDKTSVGESKMIHIKQSQTADTRTCDYNEVDKETLLKSSHQHKSDVSKGLEFFSNMIMKASSEHDKTKVSKDGIDMFHKDFKSGFKSTKWWDMHQKEERHHLSKPEYVQDDVNLVDILEMIVDGVMAGLARTGSYDKEFSPIPDDLLRKAFNNTVDTLLDNVKVID